MTNQFPRGAGILLALGIFFIVQCATTGSQQFRYGVTVQGSNPEQILNWVDKSLSENPNQPTLWLVKAEALHAIALQESSIGDRIAMYRDMHTAVIEVEDRALPFRQEQALARLLVWKDSLVTSAWGLEFGQAIELMTFDESDKLETSFATVIAHLQNAITIHPDTLISYERMSTVFYRHGDLPGAVEALELGMQQSSIPPDSYLEKLAFLYLETGNLEAAITVYREIRNRGAGDVNIRNAYLNALILSGNHDEAVRELEAFLTDLQNSSPPGARGTLTIRSALLSERLYKLESDAKTLLEMVMGGGLALDRVADLSLQFNRVEALLTGLEKEQAFLDDTETLYSVAVQHIRLGKVLQDAAALFSEQDDVELVNRTTALRKRVLTRSIPLWSRLNEINPENREILQTLIGLHESLGEKGRADELRRRLQR